jgi:hypothetical protein
LALPPVASSSATVFFSSAFLDPEGGGHGGNRRARQVYELLKAAGFDLIGVALARGSAAQGLKAARLGSVARYLRDVHLGPVRRSRVGLGFARNYGDAVRKLRLHPQTRVLIWEDTFNAHVLRAAKDLGVRVIAIPQNLESLVPGFVEARTRQSLPWSFEYEIAQLRAADRVYTISREEQWLLRLRGVAASYLPFFPDPELRRRWLDLRSRRVGPRDRFVVLGSATNPPTRAGIVELIDWFRGRGTPGEVPIHVVGHGTESLSGLGGGRIVVEGHLPEAELDAHLVRARAVILHQPAAVGALIRVSEMLLAGIPLLANPIAARSTAGYEGVRVYESLPELSRLLAEDELPPPPVPPPPAGLEQEFVANVAEWSREK